MEETATIGIYGASGRLGKAIASEILQSGSPSLGPLLVHRQSPQIGSDIGHLLGRNPLGKCLAIAPSFAPDVWIDVSVAAGLSDRLPLFAEQKKPVVIGTTGFSEDALLAIQILSQTIPVFYAPNFSLGMALMHKFAKQAALYFPLSTHIDLIETHHSKKKDAPSGSAIQLARAIQTAAPDRAPIPIHSIRSGQVAGEHTLLFNTGEEKFAMTHEIENRSAFAKGALRAASFLRMRDKGLYTMDDLINAMRELG